MKDEAHTVIAVVVARYAKRRDWSTVQSVAETTGYVPEDIVTCLSALMAEELVEEGLYGGKVPCYRPTLEAVCGVVDALMNDALEIQARPPLADYEPSDN